MSKRLMHPVDSTIYGSAVAPTPTPEQATTPLTCLDGCDTDHVTEAARGVEAKTCHSVIDVAVVAPSYDLPEFTITAMAWTEGAVRSAEVGMLRAGEHPDRTSFFDPDRARTFAEVLLRAARQAEDLARTAQAVTA